MIFMTFCWSGSGPSCQCGVKGGRFDRRTKRIVDGHESVVLLKVFEEEKIISH